MSLVNHKLLTVPLQLHVWCSRYLSVTLLIPVCFSALQNLYHNPEDDKKKKKHFETQNKRLEKEQNSLYVAAWVKSYRVKDCGKKKALKPNQEHSKHPKHLLYYLYCHYLLKKDMYCKKNSTTSLWLQEELPDRMLQI